MVKANRKFRVAVLTTASVFKLRLYENFANVIEHRLDDEDCVIESVIADNAEKLKLAQMHDLNYILIEDKYEIKIDL